MEMIYFFAISLFLFGTVFGSFASVLLHRLKSGEGGIIDGRSHCPNCHTTLKWYDLIPLLSYVSTIGKCRYCKTPIGYIYPLLEISTGVVFSLIGVFLIDVHNIFLGNTQEIVQMIFLLLIGYITILYTFYDILFMEIHEGIMGVGIGLALLGAIIQNTSGNLLYTLGNTGNDTLLLIGASMVFLGIFYIIMLKELHEVFDILLLTCLGTLFFFLYSSFDMQPLLSALGGMFGIFIFFYLQIFLSRGKALGGGDLRIGIMIGLLLGIQYSMIGVIFSYIIGSIIGIFILVQNRKKVGPSEVPFGPFLGMGFLLTLLYGPYIFNLLEQELLFL